MVIHKKRSQATIFLILGIVIFVTIFLLIIVSKDSVKKTLSQEVIETNKLTFTSQPVKNFVEECLSLVSKKSLVDFNENSTEDQLENFVKDKIDLCLDFSVFEEQGLSFSKKEAIVEVDINKKDVSFRMEYPIIITRPSRDITEIKDFLVRHELLQEGI